MFEEEMEMEKRQSSMLPLLLILVLIGGIVGVAGYFIVQSRRVLTEQEASSFIVQALKSQGPAMVSFHTGTVMTRVDDPHAPQYRLLEKVGILKLGKTKGTETPVALTAQGEELLKQIAGVSVAPVKGEEGISLYRVPLATRKLVGPPKVTMTGAGKATVEFSWKWEPNVLGESFDAAGPMMKSFSSWDRSTLIDKHGASFFHGDTSKFTLSIVRDDQRWKIAGE